MNLGATWHGDPWEVAFLANYYDAIRTVNDATDPTYDFVEGASWIFDASVRYDFGNGLTLRFGMQNLLDTMPDGDPTGWDGPALPWSIENSQWGLAGRVSYLRAAYTF
jgi:outer membrane receptor protein involved in Fe transport